MPSPQTNLSEIELPAELGAAFASVSNRQEQPKTVLDALDVIESLVSGGDQLSVEQFYQPMETRHKITFANSSEYVPCVLDALIIAKCAGENVESINSQPPTESSPVEIRYRDGDVVTDPDDFVMSLGLSATDGGDSTIESQNEFCSMGEVDLCGYINAFSSKEEYTHWQVALTNGVVMMLNGQTAINLAAAAASRWQFDSSL
ncbi:organomercurial lyase [Natribaculum luteum]|uniref:Organomercurial lyase n=1 Tax=Natribaculum luteum TaxID=1586232 RepID=A0ABD5NV77_9EURY|nr:organomercurial lyase [Natribaculum luteum]